MGNPIKSGKEILDDFFGSITGIPNVDTKIAEKLRDLYQAGKLTNTNISNLLAKLRDENANSQD